MIKNYRRTTTIQAEQFDGSQKKMFGYRVIPSSIMDVDKRAPAYYSIFINDDEPEPDDDDLPVDDIEIGFEIGDWVVKESDEIKVLADEKFKRTNAELPVISRYVADIIEDYKSNHDMGALMYVATHGKLDDGDWIFENMETVCRAWLDGYQVEESE